MDEHTSFNCHQELSERRVVLQVEGFPAFLSVLLTDAGSCSLAAIGIPSMQKCGSSQTR